MQQIAQHQDLELGIHERQKGHDPEVSSLKRKGERAQSSHRPQVKRSASGKKFHTTAVRTSQLMVERKDCASHDGFKLPNMNWRRDGGTT
jgi:hypothetical protein